MKLVSIHPDAESEIVETAIWYETRQADLGKRFLASVRDALTRIGLNPLLYPIVEGDARRCLCKTFPFGVVFRAHSNFIAVIAVMHLHRDPGYWTDRVVNDG